MADHDQLASMRALAHPLRVRMLSMLTGSAMSAADIARELNITHANASYHLRQLESVGEVVVESEERIRGGVAKMYRYPVGPLTSKKTERAPGYSDNPDIIRPYIAATHHEVMRRLEDVTVVRSDSDLETWVSEEVWQKVLKLYEEATVLLHREAKPARTPETIHVSATALAFEMKRPQ